MEKVRIVVDQETLELTPLQLVSGEVYERISGVIYVQLGDHPFPSPLWYDLCASILAMWLLTVNKHLLGRENVARLHFMDGNYSIELVYQNNRQSLMRFMEPNETCVLEREIDIRYFARQMLAASARIIDHFPQNRNSRNIQEISELTDVLRNTLRKIRTQERK